MKTKLPCVAINVAPDISLYHVGPALDHGPLPSLFYFALSGRDSLSLDPYNQPVQFLQSKMIRIFSMDLPAHENELPAKDAIGVWAEDLSHGHNFFSEFFDKVSQALLFAIREQFIDPNHLGIGGLSRGGFVSLHLAALEPRFRTLLLFAPMTDLSHAKEFQALPEEPHLSSLDLFPLAEKLSERHVRFYIGNRDEKVSTKKCFSLASAIVDAGFQKTKKAPPVSFITTPSIGHLGHGTSMDTFQQGALWMAEQLTISS